MKKSVILLALAALLAGACADTSSSRRHSGIIDLANTCATCGASVRDDYFAGSAFRAVGPGNY